MTQERVEEATRSFLADHPDFDDELEVLLEREQTEGSWAYDDTAVDSGRFGELVSREFVEKTDDGNYQFTDPDAVETVLSGATDTETETTAPDATSDGISFDVSLPEADPYVFGPIAAALTLVAAVRMIYYNTVFRDGRVVSPQNDPYFFRYWQERLLEQSSGITDFGMLVTVGEQTSSRPLTHTLNWWLTELLGGSPSAATTVAAWQPIVTTVLCALVLYALVIQLTSDHRVALASLLFLAFTPVHVVYTALGFIDHPPFQYLWLTLLAFSMVWLAVDLHSRMENRDPKAAALGHCRHPRTWWMAAVLGFAVATSAHAYGGSALTFIPVALSLGLRVVSDIRNDVPPLLANAPLLAGLGFGSFLTVGAHVILSWHESIAATVPTLVTVGGVVVAVLATAWHHVDLPPVRLLAVELVLALVGGLAFRQLRPEDVSRLRGRISDLFGREGIAETVSLFTTDIGVIMNPLTQIGLGFYFGLALLLFVSWHVTRQYEPGWLVVVCFTWVYLLLAAIQIRFASQLSIFLSVLAGGGLIHLLGATELIEKPQLFADPSDRTRRTISIPDLQRGAYLVVGIGLVLLLNLIFVPALLGQVQHDETFDAATAIDEHTNSRNSDHPEFVLSRWGDNRMYNYFVSGDAQSYGYARNNHETFVGSSDPDAQYDQHANQVGYVVLLQSDLPPETTHHKLFEQFGAGNESAAHYQLLYTTDEVRAFALVEGAVINATVEPDATVTATTDVSVMDESFTYRRNGTANASGTVEIRVAYPGEYDINGKTVTVTEQDVYRGRQVHVDE